jgi:hypothetical protein
MKGLCYIVLILAFFIYYQQNPVFTVIIIIIGLGVYFYFKSRRSNSSSGPFAFFSRQSPPNQNKSLEDLITLMMLQQTFNSSFHSPSSKEKKQNSINKNEDEDQIEAIKQEVLALLEDK